MNNKQQSKAEQSKAEQRRAERSKAKQSNAAQSKAKRSEAKQSNELDVQSNPKFTFRVILNTEQAHQENTEARS